MKVMNLIHRCSAGLVLFMSLFLSQVAFAQLVDDFSDGDFTSNPQWTGTTENFTVNIGRLQLSDTAPLATQSYLATANNITSLANKEWRIWVNQAFSGSDANNTRIYLTASGEPQAFTGNNSAGVMGYYIKMGESGSADVIRVYRDNGTSTTLIASGTTTIANAFSAGIKVIRDADGQWTLAGDFVGNGNYITEATFTEGTFNNATHFAIVCTYTSSNASNFSFDNVYVGDVEVDTTAPALVSAQVTGNNALDVLFNEPLNATSAQTIANYNVNNGMGAAATATLDGSNTALVHLTFANSFTPNINYTLTVQNVEDVNGNAISAQQQSFVYYQLGTATHRDVVLNELLADPSPVVGLPEAEFVELFNTHSTLSFDLAGWEFVNTNTVKVLPSHILTPGSYVILCDANNVSQFGSFGHVIGIPSFTALTNSTDSLTLKSPSGEIIDVVVYQDSWFATTAKRDGGWTLELINPHLPCQSSNNWRESGAAQGGTPGAINSVFDDTPDTTAPTVLSVSATDAQTLVVMFSESVVATSTTIPDWDVMPFNSVSDAAWNANFTSVTLILAQEMVAPNTYTLVVSGMSDCSGNEMIPSEHQFAMGFAPEQGDVLINEIMADPDPAVLMPAAEYIELINTTDKLLDISALRLNNGIFIGQVLLQPDSFIVVAHINNQSMFASIPNVAFMNSFPSLTNSGMLIQLKTAAGEVWDAVQYSDEWYRDDAKKNGGWSLELVNPFAPCSGAYNWRASQSTMGGTAGTRNSVFDDSPDESTPAFQYLLLAGTQGIQFFYNKPLGFDFMENIKLTVNGTLQTGLNMQLSGPENNAVLIGYTNLQPGQIYTYSLEGVTDCWGNVASIVHGTFGLPETPEAGDIIINEVLHNPYDGGSDFVELYNRSSKVISLNNWKIADASSGSMNNPKNIALVDYIMMPGEYLVLTRKPDAVKQFYSSAVPTRFWTVSDLPDYSSSDEVFLLFSNLLTVSDHLSYNSDMHYPLLNSTKGISLERISFYRASDDVTNWHSAASSVGYATPGYRNSQSQSAMNAGTDFTVSPEIFSPDNDGYNDVVSFTYTLDKEGYTGNIKIFDSEGRPVRHLMKSDLLGTEGTISWDGFTDERQKASVGIYIVFFEAFTPDGNIVNHKKSCVLAHSLN
jgi:hypothetical protein